MVTAISPAIAYEEVDMDACVIGAMNAAYRKNMKSTMQDIRNYCHCALSRMIDQQRPASESLRICNKKYGQ